MSLEEVQITHQGYTDTAYSSCGDKWCTEVIVKCVGVTEQMLAEVAPQDINNLDIGGDVQVTVALLGESDSCEWCATCGSFLRHGIYYPGEDAGCHHGPDAQDPAGLPGPHIDLQERPAMREYWGRVFSGH